MIKKQNLIGDYKMNKGICEGCLRYSKNDENPESWYCAQTLTKELSRVVPGLVVYNKDYFSLINGTSEVPKWCDYLLEQTVSDKDDEIKRNEPKKSYMSSKAQEIINERKGYYGVFGCHDVTIVKDFKD